MTDIDPGDGSRNVTLDTRGDVLVTTDSGGVTKINTNGAIIPFASGLIDPHGLEFRPKRYNHDTDGVGNLLVADTGAGQIYDYTVDGNRTLFGTAGGSPNFLAFETIFPAKADFNGDGKSDILWENSSTGQHGSSWFMDGTSPVGTAGLAIVATSWKIVGSGDFNGGPQLGHSLAKQRHRPARDLAHERHKLLTALSTWEPSRPRGTSWVRAISMRTASRTFSGKTALLASTSSGS